MRIRVVMPTVRSGGKFAAVLEQMRDFASGKHEISWTVVCNEDDADTLARMPAWVSCNAGSPMVPYMQRCNEAALDGECDWLMLWSDDNYSLTCWWDEYVAHEDGEKTPLISWRCEDEGFGPLVMTARFARALGQPYTAWFPFWFVDSWMDEIHRMAFDAPAPFIDGLESFSRRGKTRMMRDLAFWASFFRETRPDRLQQARLVMAAYGGVREIPAAQLVYFAEFDRVFAERIPEFEAFFKPEHEALPAHYPAMRAAAERHLLTLKG